MTATGTTVVVVVVGVVAVVAGPVEMFSPGVAVSAVLAAVGMCS